MGSPGAGIRPGRGGDAGHRAQTTASDVAVKLYALKNMMWQKTNPVGLGDSYRGSDNDVLATALVADGDLVHLGVSIAT